MLAGLLGYISLQLKQSSQKIAWNQSLQIAEAGIEYYRWCVNNGVEENCSGQEIIMTPPAACGARFRGRGIFFRLRPGQFAENRFRRDGPRTIRRSKER